ncbi:MAG: S8 family serine peptidase, partial [Flavobacteriales bacterium]|nr:S8 family serine peptidase [Flavobacteriales bacterium]
VFTWFEYENNLDVGGSGVFFELWADTNEMAELNFSMGADKSDFPYSTRGVTEPISYMDCLGSTVSREIRNDSDDLLAIAQFWSQYRGEQVQMQVSIIDPDSSEFNFRFQAMGSGSYDIWSTSVFGTSDIINGEDIPEVSEFPEIAMYRAPDKRMNMVSSWTCSDKVITVANYMNRVSYIDYTGELATVPGIDGEINESSSSGPTRDGRQKPDIAATGSVTLSTGNFPMLDYLIQNEPFKVAQGGMHFRNGGSSMASPVLAGIAALYLEQCPNTTWESFRNAVINTAAIDEFATEAPDRYWGHGKVNAFGVVAFDAIELDIQQSGSELMASGGDSYQWYLDSEVLEGETGSTLTIIGPGLYIVEAFNQAGCAVFSEPFLVTDLNSYSKPVFKIWPNPVKDLLRFEGLENSQGIVITDSYGAKILSLDYRPNLAIDVSRFSSGLYFVEVRAEDSMQIKKLIIE